MSIPMLELSNLSIGYQSRRQRKTIAQHINAEVFQGDLVCLLGPNGAGKSTLLRTIAGMQPTMTGSIYLNQQNLHKLPPKKIAQLLSMVLTERINAGILSVYELVALGRYPYTTWTGTLSKNDEETIQWALAIVGAQNLRHRYFHELSDGEKQKVLIARALAQKPKLLLLDEPTAFLDFPRRVATIQMLVNLAHQQNYTIIVSTHELNLALQFANKVWLLSQSGEWLNTIPEKLTSHLLAKVFQTKDIHFEDLVGKAIEKNCGSVDEQRNHREPLCDSLVGTNGNHKEPFVRWL